jgi:Ca2+-binding RTX toxin-like protein
MARIEFGSNQTVRGTSADDTLVGIASPVNVNDIIYGNEGNDLIYAVNGVNNSTIYGGDGNVTIFADVAGMLTKTNNDVIYGGLGNDSVVIFGANNKVFGGGGNDTISVIGALNGVPSNAVNDVVYGNKGNDSLYIQQATKAVAYGGAGDDSIGNFGGPPNEPLVGRGGDVLYGNQGNDTIRDCDGPGFVSGTDTTAGSSQGNSVLYGGQGDDTLFAQEAGGDTMFGGGGNNLFAANDGTRLDGFFNANDLITVGDFTSGQDRLALSTLVAGDLNLTKVNAPGASNASVALGVANDEYAVDPTPAYLFIYGGTGAGYLFYNGDNGGARATGGMILVGDNGEASLQASDIVASNRAMEYVFGVG